MRLSLSSLLSKAASFFRTAFRNGPNEVREPSSEPASCERPVANGIHDEERDLTDGRASAARPLESTPAKRKRKRRDRTPETQLQDLRTRNGKADDALACDDDKDYDDADNEADDSRGFLIGKTKRLRLSKDEQKRLFTELHDALLDIYEKILFSHSRTKNIRDIVAFLKNQHFAIVGNREYGADPLEPSCQDAVRSAELAFDAVQKNLLLCYNPSMVDDVFSKARIHTHHIIQAVSSFSAQDKPLSDALDRYIEIRNKLISANIALVYRFASILDIPDHIYTDVLSSGFKYLLEYVENFDLRHDRAFSTYAFSSVLQKMKRDISENLLTVHVPVHIASEKRNLYNRTAEELRQKLHREPSAADIAAACNTSEQDVDFVFSSCSQNFSLDSPLSDEEDGNTQLDLLEDNSAADPSAAADRFCDRQLIFNLIRCSGISQEEKDVLLLRYGIRDDQTDSNAIPPEPMTLEQVAALKNLSRERIRNICDSALNKIKKHVKHVRSIKKCSDGGNIISITPDILSLFKLARLDSLQRRFFCLYHGIGMPRPLSLSQIASCQTPPISTHRVNQIVRKASVKINAALARNPSLKSALDRINCLNSCT